MCAIEIVMPRCRSFRGLVDLVERLRVRVLSRVLVVQHAGDSSRQRRLPWSM
jgi:hypothetical protein